MAKRRVKGKTPPKRNKSSGQKRPARGTKRQQQMLLITAVVLLIFLGLIAIPYTYVYRQLSLRLQAREFTQKPAIYSDALRIRNGAKLTRESFSSILLARDYHEQDPPQHPGEFHCGEESCAVITREFKGIDGGLMPSTDIRYLPATGVIENHSLPESKNLWLEPKVLTSLGREDIRASSARPLSSIPKSLQQAVIAIEDSRFYDHWGIDSIGILRALFTNLRAGRIVQGGSTLTQQLAKNLFLSPQRTLRRKFLEALSALELERRFSKDQILELYLNQVYFGQDGEIAIHGVAQASQFFFGKPIEQISLAESAILAGIIRAPSFYSPRKHLNRARERSTVVLARMLELGFISAQDRARALAQRVTVVPGPRNRRSSSHFVQALRESLKDQLDLSAASLSGTAVYTGLHSELQRCAETALQSGLQRLNPNGSLEGAVVALEPYSGIVRAWIGSRDFTRNQFDHVQQARRPIGSTVKPFLYLAALDKKLNHYRAATAVSILPDRPLQIKVPGGVWEPENYDRIFHGDVTLRYALENSLNLPAVYVVKKIGVPALTSILERFKLGTKITGVPSLALGSIDATLLDLTSAYGAIANGGLYVSPRTYLAAIDGAGEIVARSPIDEFRVADEAPSYVLTNILQGVVERGTGKAVRRAGYDGVAAGKTGTSDDARDAWFVGFTPTLVAGVWLGFDDNRVLGLTGGAAAAPIWADFMKCGQPFVESADFVIPKSVVTAKIDAGTNELATTQCPADLQVNEIFVEGTEPNRACHIHGGAAAPPGPARNTGQEFQDESDKPSRSLWDNLFGG